MIFLRFTTLTAAACAALTMVPAAQAQAPQPCAGLPPGRHALLERMTASMNLTCEQQLKIEPLLHDEESVTKPLLKFTALSTADEQGIMTTIKLAARRQVRNYLTPDQQKGMDSEVDSVTNSKGGKKKDSGKKAAEAPTFADEETLSNAIVAYVALTPDEKNAMLLKVKNTALADADLQLTPDQKKKLETEIKGLKK
jgi:hypothetical protein